MRDPIFLIVGAVLGSLAVLLLSRPASHPLADHKSYMFGEIPDLMAFTNVEMKIDNYLLELERREP